MIRDNFLFFKNNKNKGVGCVPEPSPNPERQESGDISRVLSALNVVIYKCRLFLKKRNRKVKFLEPNELRRPKIFIRLATATLIVAAKKSDLYNIYTQT